MLRKNFKISISSLFLREINEGYVSIKKKLSYNNKLLSILEFKTIIVEIKNENKNRSPEN